MPGTDEYKGLDLNNKDSMRIAVDMWDAVVNQAEYIKNNEAQKQLEIAVEDAKKQGNKNIRG